MKLLRYGHVAYALVLLGSFGMGLPAGAATTATPVNGELGTNAHGCLQVLTQNVGDSENCMYDGGPTAAGIDNPAGEVTGPYEQVHYYDSAATPAAFSPAFLPTPNSGQIRQKVEGTVTIDDNGTPGDGTDDLISFSLTLSSPGAGDVIRHLGDDVVDRYTSMTQVLAPRAVDSATANAAGGFDYVIGSEGFPTLLTFDSPTEPAAASCARKPFGSMDCPATFAGGTLEPDRWTGTTRAGLGSLEENVGARTVGTLLNPACVDTGANNDCRDSKVSFAPLAIGPNQVAPQAAAEDVGWDQLLLKVSTDGSGQVVKLAGFDLQEYQVFGGTVVRCGSDPNPQGPCNSWISGFFCAPGSCANDDGPVLAEPNVEVIISALDNDIGFADPVTVSIISGPAAGVAEVQVNGVPGNNGNRADLRIAYTAGAGGASSDSFTYQISDGVITDSATVMLSLEAAADLVPSISIWDISADQGQASPRFRIAQFITFGNGAPAEHAVTVTTPPTANGVCTVSPADGTGELFYTPNPGFIGTDNCTVTVTDIDGDSASDTVNLVVNPTGEVQPDIGGASSLGWGGLLLLLVAGLWRRPRRAAGGLLATALAFGAGGAQAQEVGDAAEASPGLVIQEIVVTARKVEEKLKEVPVAITAFDSAAIESAGIVNLTDVAALTPGLTFFNPIGESLPVPVIRGVAPTDIFGENNAAIFVDGVYISGREGLNFSQLDIERIEVVKGPQSALYGRNAFSGAINYVTKKPSQEFDAKATAEMGNRDRRKGTLSVSGPILGESFRGRASVLYDEWDGSYTNSIPGGPDIGGYRYRSYQTSLLWQPAEAWEINLSYYKSNDDIDEPSIMGLPPNCEDRVEPPPNTADNPVQAGARLQNFCGQVPDLDEIPGGGPNNTMPKIREAAGQNRELDRASFTIDWNLYEYGSLTALTGYSKTDEDALFDFGRGTGYNQPFRYCAAADDQGPQVPNRCLSPADEIFFTGVLDVEPGDETEEWSQELRWTSPQDQRLRVTGGAYWFKRNLDNKEGNPVAAPFDGNNPLPQPAPGAAAIGLPPFNPPNPDLAIGTAIFYGMFADNPFTPGYDPDGGVEPDPLGRSTKEVDTESWALFTGADFDLTDRLTSRAELRYSQEAEEVTLFGYTRCQQAGYVVDPGDGSAVLNPCLDDVFDLRSPAALPTCVPGENRFGSVAGQDVLLCSPEASSRFDSWTGRGGLKFQATDDWMIYGSIAYGEKPGGANLVIAALAAIPGAEGSTVIVDDFDPEKITAYELGAKGFLFDRRVSLDVAAFWNDWRDIVLRQLQDKDDEGRPLEQPAGVNINAGDATVLGAEASVQVLFTENLTGNFTLSWTDAELDDARQDTYSRFPSFRADGCFPEDAPPGTPEENKAWFENCNAISGDVSGNQLLRQPEWTSSASLSYRRELVDDWEWYVRGDANYLSDVYIGNDNASWLAARTVVNTKFGLSSRKYRIEIWARNLFDERSATGAYRDIWFANSDNLYPPYTNQGPRPNFDDFVPWRVTTSFPNGRTYGITGEIRFGAGAL